MICQIGVVSGHAQKEWTDQSYYSVSLGSVVNQLEAVASQKPVILLPGAAKKLYQNDEAITKLV